MSDVEDQRTYRYIVVAVAVVAMAFVLSTGGCALNLNDNRMEMDKNRLAADTKRVEACITAKGMPVRVVAIDNRNVTSIIYACNLSNPNFP